MRWDVRYTWPFCWFGSLYFLSSLELVPLGNKDGVVLGIDMMSEWGALPLVQAHVVLDEKKDLIWQIGGPKSRCEVDVFEKHPA